MMALYTPNFSIIIPTYSRPKQLAICLESLTYLDYPRDRFEVIIVDDGSEPPLNPVVEKFQGRLDVRLIRQQNAGPAAARNTGIASAKGEFIAFTDDDCIPATDWLRKFAAHFEKTPDRIIGGKTVNRLKNNLYSATSQLIVDIVYQHYNSRHDQARFFASNNIAVPTKLLKEVGAFKPNFRTSEDRELCDRWQHNGYRMTYAPEAIIYHAHDLSFRQFCKQHFSYGRGAHRFHKIRAERGSGKMTHEMKFHSNLSNWLLYPFKKVENGQALPLAFLLLVWQFINALGFFWEAANYNLNFTPHE